MNATSQDASGFGFITRREPRLPLGVGMELALRDEDHGAREAIGLTRPIRDARILRRDLRRDRREQAIELRLGDRGIERELQREVGAVRDGVPKAFLVVERAIVGQTSER